MIKSNLPSNEVPFNATALPRWSLTFSERQARRRFACPTEGTGSTVAGSATVNVLAGATDACTTAGALFATVFWALPEQPKMVDRMPVDSNKKTFFMLVSSQSVGRESNAQCT